MATRIRITQDDESDDDSPERKFIWEIYLLCSYYCKSKINLRKHKQRFHEDERFYICDHESCTKTIIGLSNYGLHRNSLESSPCSYCGKVLSSHTTTRYAPAESCSYSGSSVKSWLKSLDSGGKRSRRCRSTWHPSNLWQHLCMHKDTFIHCFILLHLFHNDTI